MKNPLNILGFLALLMLVCTITLWITVKKQDRLIDAYKEYYSGTENLLDELDSAYNWVDGYESYEYYASKAKIDSLKQHK